MTHSRHTYRHTRTHNKKAMETSVIHDGCYTFRRFQLPDAGVMEDTLAATFVITMAGSTERQSAIKGQLFERLHLTRTIYMVENAGFRNCAKPDLCEQTSNYDILHANIAIFEFAEAAYPGQIIAVMEDDMLWTAEAVHTPKHWAHITQFVHNHTDTMDHYMVGAMVIPCCMTPVLYDLRHIHTLFATCGQLVIHTPRGMSKVRVGYRSVDRCKWHTWQHVDIIFSTHTTYTYYRPLAIQVVEATENSRIWQTWYLRFVITLYGLDRIETAERGWDQARTTSIIISILVMLIATYVVLGGLAFAARRIACALPHCGTF